jgi:hypothetical protein
MILSRLGADVCFSPPLLDRAIVIAAVHLLFSVDEMRVLLFLITVFHLETAAESEYQNEKNGTPEPWPSRHGFEANATRCVNQWPWEGAPTTDPGVLAGRRN